MSLGLLMIRIDRSGIIYSGTTRDLDVLRAQFDQQHYIRFSGFLEPELLHFIQRVIDRGDFYERVHKGIGNDLCLRGNTAFGALLFLMNDEKLFQIIRDITKCARIGCFDGRVYRAISGQGHHDSWHDDMIDHRLLGLSINLSTEVYRGGVFQMRDRKSGEIINEVPNVGIGDAIVFRLARRFQHRITEVEGRTSKTAFAGWFRAQPDFLSLLKGNQGAHRQMTSPIEPQRSNVDSP